MLLKDPLQLEPTPYEILDIDPSADPATIKRAMGPAIIARAFDVKHVQVANQTLLDPNKRALIDLLMYPADKVYSVTQSGSQDDLLLGLDNREKTAGAWQQTLVTNFPDFVLLHALALVWYWWAKYEADRQLTIIRYLDKNGVRVAQVTRKGTLLTKIAEVERCGISPGASCPNESCAWHQDCIHNAPGLYETWEKAIAYSTLLIYTPKIWEEMLDGNTALADNVGHALRVQIEAELTNLNKFFSGTSASTLAGQFQQLLIDFETERKTASLMKGLKFTFNNPGRKAFSLGTGRLLMREMNQLTTVRNAIESGIKAGTGSLEFLQSLNDLHFLLSPYANIAHQINRGRWNQALDMIKALSADDQAQPEVCKMKAQALIGKGVQEMELGKDATAIQDWREAKSIQSQGDIWREAKEDIQREVLKRVAVISQASSEKAVTLLESVLEIVNDCQQLKSRLGVLYFSAGIEIINSVPEELNASDRSPDQSDVDKIQRGIDLLEKAGAYGDSRASDQIHTAREVMGQLNMIVALESVNQLRELAVQSAKTGQWGQAAIYLWTALDSLPPDAPAELRKTITEELSICQNNSQPQERPKANEVESLRSKAAEAAQGDRWNSAVDYLEQALSKCPLFGSRDLKKQIEKDMAICLMNGAVQEFNWMAERVKDGSATYNQLQEVISEAKAKLKRAKRLDPKNMNIKKNFDAINEL